MEMSAGGVANGADDTNGGNPIVCICSVQLN